MVEISIGPTKEPLQLLQSAKYRSDLILSWGRQIIAYRDPRDTDSVGTRPYLGFEGTLTVRGGVDLSPCTFANLIFISVIKK